MEDEVLLLCTKVKVNWYDTVSLTKRRTKNRAYENRFIAASIPKSKCLAGSYSYFLLNT